MPRPSSGRKPHHPPARAHAADAPAGPGGITRGATLALLALAALAAFAGVTRNGFVLLDDPIYVFKDPFVRQGLTLPGLLFFLAHPHGENWHPLTSFSHMLDVQLFGLAPQAHHLVSLALHIANALLLLLVLHRLTGAWWRSTLVAALFALHPLRVESVAWIAERKDVLSGLFFLLTIAAYARWVERPSRNRWIAVLAGLVLGLMSKPMVVSLPFVLVLLDVWPLRRLQAGAEAPPASRRAPARPLAGLFAEKWLLFALAAIAAVVTYAVQHQAGAVASTELAPLPARICNALLSYARYIGKLFWPGSLAVIYPLARRANYAGALAAGLGLVAFTVLALRQSRARPWLIVGWLWYLVMLLPVIGLVQVGRQAYADRYTYLPTIGLLVALVWGASEWVERARLSRAVAGTVAAIALAALAVATARQVAVWRDTRTLFTHALSVTRDNAMAHAFFGSALLVSLDAPSALPQLEEALRLDPDFPNARADLGVALAEVSRFDEAIAQLEAAARRHDSADLRFDLGYVYAKQHRLDDAIRECLAALRLDPDHFGAHAQLGLALLSSRRIDEASVHLRRAAELAPQRSESPRIMRMLALGYADEGRFPEAALAAQRALELARGVGDLDLSEQCSRELASYLSGVPAR